MHQRQVVSLQPRHCAYSSLSPLLDQQYFLSNLLTDITIFITSSLNQLFDLFSQAHPSNYCRIIR